MMAKNPQKKSSSRPQKHRGPALRAASKKAKETPKAGPKAAPKAASTAVVVPKKSKRTLSARTHDAELLESARMQWQFGDWESLAKLDVSALERHPERAKLALLSASAHQQLNDHLAARRMVGLAKTWGCDKKVIAQLLIAGVHNTLARASALAHDGTRALSHFKAAVEGVSGDARLACQARSVREVTRLGMYREAGNWIEQHLGQLPSSDSSTAAQPRQQQLVDQRRQLGVQALAERCMASSDVHAAVDAELDSGILDAEDAFLLCVALSDQFKERKDNLTAIHFLNNARRYVDEHDLEKLSLLSKKLIATGQNDEALDILVSMAVSDPDLSAAEKKSLAASYAKARTSVQVKESHGHEVLLAYLRSHADNIMQHTQGRRPVLIEIGSTRENIKGQGSSRIIAEYCSSSDIDFITVDMDPHNTAEAAAMFRRLGVDFKAVNAKGEDYLREYVGDMDFVFLDAYDFDHGKHSELRQSRYQKYLGGSIDEKACHQMHLDCAQSVQEKISSAGLVCIDDTWLVDGKWCAKGTLAVPYLLEHDFEIVEARNRAALLRRKHHGS